MRFLPWWPRCGPRSCAAPGRRAARSLVFAHTASWAGSSGTITMLLLVDALHHLGGDLVGGVRRLLDQPRRELRWRPRRCRSIEEARGVRKKPGHTAETRMPNGCELVGQRLAEGDHSCLDRGVRRHGRWVHQPGQRGGVDDVTAALRLHHRDERAAPADDAEQVDVDDPLPLVDADHVDPPARRDAGVVDEDVEPAPLLLDPCERCGPVVVRRHVELDPLGALDQRRVDRRPAGRRSRPGRRARGTRRRTPRPGPTPRR